MELRRQDLDALAFGAALLALGVAAVAFFITRNGAACVMAGLCLAGLVGGRLVGISGLTLLPVALGLAAILYFVWIDPPAGSRKTSALAHAAGGALAGMALAATLRRRIAWPLWAAAAVAGVLVLTVVWELGEYLGDRVLDTALIPNRRDSAEDVFFGCFGGAAGVTAYMLLVPRIGRAR